METTTKSQMNMCNEAFGSFFSGPAECPHLHFNLDLINREALTREEHMNLLATPKGYQWEQKERKKCRKSWICRKKPGSICGGRRLRNIEKSYIQNFLAEMWTLFTPDLENRLKGVLCCELGLSPEEAEEFMIEQRELNIKRSATVGVDTNIYYCPDSMRPPPYTKRENARKPCKKLTLGERHFWIKEFNHTMACTLNAYVMAMIMGKRTRRTKGFSEMILQVFSNLIGTDIAMESPQTKLQKLCVFIADRLGVFLGGVACTTDEQIMEAIRILDEKEKEVPPEEEEEEEEEEVVVEVEEELIELEAMELEGEAVFAEEIAEEEVIEEFPEEEFAEELVVAEELELEEILPEEAAPEEIAIAEEVPVPEEAPILEEVPIPEPVVVVPEPLPEVVPPVEVPPPPPPQPPQLVEEEAPPVVFPPPLEIPPPLELAPVMLPEVVPEEVVEEAPPEPEAAPSKIDIYAHVISWIEETEPEETPREQALDSVITDRLMQKIMPEDEELAEAIRAASRKVATWIDKLVAEVEKEFGRTEPVAPPPKKITYHIKKDYLGPFYTVKEISSGLVCEKVREGRSEQAKAITRAIVTRPKKPEGPIRPKEMKKWAKWATDVAGVAEHWAGWIGKTCAELEEKTTKHKERTAAMSKGEWEKWKRDCRNRAIEWSKNKKLLKEAAQMWQKKSQGH